ncbi:unnamed protein product [Gadus morhua 'NCC']
MAITCRSGRPPVGLLLGPTGGARHETGARPETDSRGICLGIGGVFTTALLGGGGSGCTRQGVYLCGSKTGKPPARSSTAPRHQLTLEQSWSDVEALM